MHKIKYGGERRQPTRSPRSDPMAGAGVRIRLVREMMWMLPGCFFPATQVVGMTSVLLRLQVRHVCRLRSAIFFVSRSGIQDFLVLSPSAGLATPTVVPGGSSASCSVRYGACWLMFSEALPGWSILSGVAFGGAVSLGDRAG
jgi:hypothetical protein